MISVRLAGWILAHALTAAVLAGVQRIDDRIACKLHVNRMRRARETGRWTDAQAWN